MPVQKIVSIKNHGILRNIVNPKISDFGRYNLIYGWNGSGKSTLSSLFRSIQNRTLSGAFPNAEFALKLVDGNQIASTTLAASNLNIHTFNREFIEENINWNDAVKSMLLVDKEKISERQQLDSLRAQNKQDEAKHQTEQQEIQKLDAAISKFGTDSARHIKTSLQSIDTGDNYYLNYDRRKFERFISDNQAGTKDGQAILNDDQILQLIKAAKPDQKGTINFQANTVGGEILDKAKTRLDEILKTSVVSQVIKRLVDNPDIKSWVETGLALHKSHAVEACEFCGNQISPERIKKLEAHFNDEYKTFQARLQSAESWLTGQLVNVPPLPAEAEFYDEFRQPYIDACAGLNSAIQTLNFEIQAWQKALGEKISNPLDTSITISSVSHLAISTHNEAIQKISTVVFQHNHKSQNFNQETTKAKKRLELHYTTKEITDFDYHSKKAEVTDRTNSNLQLLNEINARKAEIAKIEDSLSNESLGAEQFNLALHKFLGRTELALKFNQAKKGYVILRNDTEHVKGNLSEGEKTAIAFVYFITKLSENDNDIAQTIVVIDDPISSFDSNHLFHAYSYLRANCEKSSQLFVLTHNFTFFKLVRDWISRLNTKSEPDNSKFYVVRANNESPRSSTLNDADKALTVYNSEYHYIFSRLNALKTQESLATDDHFLAANLSRKLLESFLSFKFPKNRGNFASLFNHAISASTLLDADTQERIRKFINQYSHSDFIETDHNLAENVAGESVAVITDVFNWIDEMDSNHFQEMMQSIS
ncbi:AAA family ATPase [Pseudomonas nitroreducens]|uniref:AAA family ATPase n=1 Tax=Pseudomonas nitroreducens TaxID=46680 RepID=UPI002D7F3126|nr:AAA family ATPase [Pseudomonas nitroreducens]